MSNIHSWFWIPDKQNVFTKAQLITKNDKTAKVKLERNGEIEDVKISELNEVNPASFDKVDDMSELTHLNEPSVLYNLENRYKDDLIYTYSGLFLVAINPYHHLTIYSQNYINLYHGSPKEDTKPHIFATAELAYRNLLQQKQDQSILVTGESGAGKTENTKKILQYLASITTRETQLSTSTANKESFEQKILQSNPILEAFGNAQTVRNNNSSRFGKFIKIEFDEYGKINGAHIEWYLLEKSRVVLQNSKERNYHIFYQLLAGMDQKTLTKYEIPNKKATNWNYLKNTNLSIPGVDDGSNFTELIEAFNTVGFTTEEQENIFQIISAILHLGNIEYTSERSEQASIRTDLASLVKLLGVEEREFKDAILKPKSKAGREFVHKSKNATQSRHIVNSLSKIIYEKLFAFIVERINHSLNHGSMTENFIGVLDIAGFEIFKDNSFEQLCINYTNEKLQQFFNHHMFVLEQNEYMRENIQWNYIDYGNDLQQTIDLIEGTKPPGVLALLDEESILPKSTDDQFFDKLITSWESKSDRFKRSKKHKMFILKHYAGEVEYNIDGWLSKNKEPLNDHLLAVLSKSNNTLIKEFFDSEEILNTTAKSSRGSAFRTQAQRHKKQLNELIEQLTSTSPHFVRCILPNNKKKAAEFDRALILDQLRCNGVLEGIRISREGYPNRIFFKEFYQRYRILGDDHTFKPAVNNSKKNCEMLLSSLNLDPSLFKVGNTKLFFKSGVLAKLENFKQQKLTMLTDRLIGIFKGKKLRKEYSLKLKKLQAAQILAETFTKYNTLTENQWYRLYVNIKPMLSSSKDINKTKKIAETVKVLEKKLYEAVELNESLTKKNKRLNNELLEVKNKLQNESDKLQNFQRLLVTVQQRQKEVELEISQNKTNVQKLEQEKAEALTKLTKANDESNKYEKLLNDSKMAIKSLEGNKLQLEQKVKSTNAELDSIKSKELQTVEFKKKLEDQLHVLKNSEREKSAIIIELNQKLKDSDVQLEGKLKTLENSFGKASKNMMKLVGENKSLREQIQTIQAEKRDIAMKLKASQETIEHLNSQTVNHAEDLAKVTKARDELIEEYNKVLEELKEQRCKYVDYQKQAEKLKADYVELQNKFEEELRAKELEKKNLMENSELNDKISELEAELAKQGSLNQYLHEKLLSSELYPNGFNFSSGAKKNSSSYEDLALQLKQVNYQLQKIIKEKEDCISRITFLKTRLASASFDNQIMRNQIKQLKEIVTTQVPNIKDIDEVLKTCGQVDYNQEKLILEIDDLRRELQKERRAREDAENVSNLLSTKITNMSRVDLHSIVSDLQFERGLPTKTLPFSDSYNTYNANSDLITRFQNDISKYKLENMKLKDALNNYHSRMMNLKNEFLASQSKEKMLHSELDALHEDFSIAEKQNSLFSSTIMTYKQQYESCANDLMIAETELKEINYALNQSTNNIQKLEAYIKNLKSQGRQNEKLLWEKDQELNELEDRLDSKDIELQKLKKINMMMKDDIDDLATRLQDTTRDDKYMEQIEMMNIKLNEFARSEITLKKEISSLNFDLESLEKEANEKISELLRQNEHYLDVIEELGADKDNLETEVDHLTNKLESLTSENDKLNDSIGKLIEANTRFKDDREILLNELDDKDDEMEKSANSTHNIKNELVSLKNTLKAQEERTRQGELLLNQLKEDNENLELELDEQKKENIDLHEENRVLGEENNNLHSLLEKLKQKIPDATEKNVWLTRIHELEEKYRKETGAKYALMKDYKAMEKEVEDMTEKIEQQAEALVMANRDREDFDKEINEYLMQMKEMDKKLVSQGTHLHNVERDNDYYRSKVAALEKELEMWKQRYTV
ncbi:myosin 1 SCDLUD_004824 [Saccharomycodes ludwigii]|uniref:myosin 1 n=1 Tax=Saccharomycodes ludwigii TaxID=36035 RepID=UPI001E838B20|nr:hypothetical protein SCDLUD_004824 [Saccharomycodes ludwigii]KAH3899381.1 hypothetical protein SCDLUD_004824 [Saccharomycodes ludwigii]